MKVVILVGGFGTRLMEKTTDLPKPMVPIGNKPILWHIMSHFSHYGFNDFVLCLGYKGEVIKNYFMNLRTHNLDMRIDIGSGSISYLSNGTKPWTVSLIDTGLHTGTGGRLKRVRGHLGTGPFFMTYGDGVADVDLMALKRTYENQHRPVMVTAVSPPSKYGYLKLNRTSVEGFEEKPPTLAGNRINGGYFVIKPDALDNIQADHEMWEKEPITRLIKQKQVAAFMHDGFWQCMDTLRDQKYLESLDESGNAPWKMWEKTTS